MKTETLIQKYKEQLGIVTKNLHTNKQETLGKKWINLWTQNFLKLGHRDTEILSKPVTVNEMQAAMKKSTNREIQDQKIQC